MELVGIIRCPVDSLLPYGEGRQIDPDVVKRLAKYFEKAKSSPENEDNFIRGIITYNDLGQILSKLQLSKDTLKHTTAQRTYPLLTGHTIACLDGRHRIRAAIKHKPRSWWVVKLLCVQGSWIEFPLKIALASIDSQVIQDQIEATSRETPYSDAEVYRLVRKYTKNHDKARVAECLSRLSAPKQVSLKGLLKRPQLVQDLDALIKFPGVIGGLQLGNIHKYLALHCDENFSLPLRHILRVWEFITNDDPRVNAAVSLCDVQYLQFRAPITSLGDRMAINRMFDQGTLFESIKDLDLRDRIRHRVLSVQIIIPSVETFHENMKYVLMGAKILRRYLVEVPTCKRNKPTLFESLASKWKNPGAQYVEYEDGKFLPTSDAPTPWHSYLTIFLAALREFARLSFEHPRQDVRGETMPAFPEGPRIQYLARLALQVGFDNPKIQETLRAQTGHPGVAQYKPQDGRPADWRGGIPFTKSYIQLRLQAFLPQLAEPVLKGNSVSPLFVIRDTICAFFGVDGRIVYDGPDELAPFDSRQVNEASINSTTHTSPEISRPDQSEDVTMEDEMPKRNHSYMPNTVRPRACRIEKGRRRGRPPGRPISRTAPPIPPTPQRVNVTSTEDSHSEPSNEPQHTILRDTGRTSGIVEESSTTRTEANFPQDYQQPKPPEISGALEVDPPHEPVHTILRDQDRTPRTSAEPETNMSDTMQIETESYREPKHLESAEAILTLQSEPPRESGETMARETSHNLPLTVGGPEGLDTVPEAEPSREYQEVESPTPPRSHVSTMPHRSDRSPTIHTSATADRESLRVSTSGIGNGSDMVFSGHTSNQDMQGGQSELVEAETKASKMSNLPQEFTDYAKAPKPAQAGSSRELEMPDRSGRMDIATEALDFDFGGKQVTDQDEGLEPLTNRKRKRESNTSIEAGRVSVAPIRAMYPQRIREEERPVKARRKI